MNAIARPFRWFATTRLAHSLRFRLILLVLLASLPSLALLLITAAQQREDALAAGQQEAQRLAQLVAADQSAVSGQIETVLGSMALTPELRGNDVAACSGMMETLTSPVSEPNPEASGPAFSVDGASVAQALVLNDDLGLFCAGTAGGGEVLEADRELATAALTTGRVTAGNYRTSSVGSLVMTYAMPVAREDQQGRRVIVAAMNVYALVRFARAASLPADAFIVVVDDESVLEQRYPVQGGIPVGTSLAGTPAVDQAISPAATEAGDAEDHLSIDGVEFVVGSDVFWMPGPTGVRVRSHALVGIPEATVVVRANEIFNENLGKLGIAAIIALIAAWVGADLFVGRDAETRKGQVRDLYHAFSTGAINTLDQLIGPGFVDRNAAPNQAPGIDGLRQNIAAFRTAFPDGKITVRELLADGDKVVARVTLSGTHVADYVGIAPSGKQVTAEGVETFRFVHGMVVESWSMFGALKPRDRVVEEAPPVVPERPRRWRLFGRRGSRSTPSEVRR